MKFYFKHIFILLLCSCIKNHEKHLFESKTNKFVYVTNYKGKTHEANFEFFYDPKQSKLWHQDVYRLETPYYHQYWYKADNSIFVSFMNSKQASKIFDFRKVVGTQASLFYSDSTVYYNYHLIDIYYSKGLLDSVFCYEINLYVDSGSSGFNSPFDNLYISKRHGIVGFKLNQLEYNLKQLD